MIYASIYRSDYDSVLNAFHGADKVFIANTSGPFEPRQGDKVGILVNGHLAGNVILVPAFYVDGVWLPQTHGMDGGTFASVCDSRFDDAIEAVVGYRFYGAVAIHDRLEI